jgi:hypothetical protein
MRFGDGAVECAGDPRAADATGSAAASVWSSTRPRRAVWDDTARARCTLAPRPMPGPASLTGLLFALVPYHPDPQPAGTTAVQVTLIDRLPPESAGPWGSAPTAAWPAPSAKTSRG